MSYVICEQHMHPRGLISDFVVHCQDSVMSLVSVTKISSLMLASVAEQASLSLTWSESPEDTFSYDEAHIFQFETEHDRSRLKRADSQHSVSSTLSTDSRDHKFPRTSKLLDRL